MISALKKEIESKKAIIGAAVTLKNLKKGNVKKIYLASNCPQRAANDIEHLAKFAGAQIVKLDIPNNELGIVCKKKFAISVIGIKQ